LSGFANSYKDLAENKTFEYKIRLTSDQVVFQFPYRKSLKERDEIKEEIKDVRSGNDKTVNVSLVVTGIG
jgi:hypothetical protein